MYFKIAGFNIKVVLPSKNTNVSLFNDIETVYKEFILINHPRRMDFTIIIRHIHFPYEFVTVQKKVGNKKIVFLNYFEMSDQKINTYSHLSINQFMYLIVRITQKLIYQHYGFILHSSASIIKNHVWIFTGNSGAGKSTIMTMLDNIYPGIADDKVIIKKENNYYTCYNGPFFENKNWLKKKKEGYKIDKVCFLHKANYFGLEKINNKNYIAKRLLNQLWVSKEDMKEQYKNILRFIKEVNNFYILSFALDKKRLIKLIKEESKKLA